MITKTKDILARFVAEVFQMVTWVVVRIAFLIFGTLKVTGKENLKKIKGSVIFAPNHANDMDPIFLRAALPLHSGQTPLYFITYPFEMYAKIAGSAFTAFIYKLIPFGIIGAVPFVPGSKDYATSLQNHIALLNKGSSVCIFPEGKVTRTGALGKPRGGVAYMAQITKHPIIPISISGTYMLSLSDFFSKRPCITIHFSRPMYAGDIVTTSDMHKVRYQKAAEHILSRIESRRIL